MSHYKPDPNKSVSLTIDGIAVTVPEGTTILEAARKANVHIPTLCDYPGLNKRAICRICVVECDGRSKLVAACANDVWEGVSIVTNSIRILNIRKTIVELLLANHPQDCLSCVRSGKCELQRLAADFGIREQPFYSDTAVRRPPLNDSELLVRDMDKCVKCGRCVEACQEIQGVRAINTARRSVNYEICAPYGQALGESSCVFCGQCAAVCPVGAVYEYDQTAEVWAALNNCEGRAAVQIASQAGAALDAEFGLPSGTITGGKLVSALKRLGFDKVVDAGVFASMAKADMGGELLDRIKNKGQSEKPRLPMICGCSSGLTNFAKAFFPDLLDYLSACNRPQRIFGTLVRKSYSKVSGMDLSKITAVSVMPCIAHKFEARQSGTTDIALTIQELARIIKLAGIDFKSLPESPFDSITDDAPGAEASASVAWANAPGRITADNSIVEAEINLQGTSIKAIAVDGLANARIVMDSIRKGECNAALVEIMSCSGGCDCCGLHLQLTGKQS